MQNADQTDCDRRPIDAFLSRLSVAGQPSIKKNEEPRSGEGAKEDAKRDLNGANGRYIRSCASGIQILSSTRLPSQLRDFAALSSVNLIKFPRRHGPIQSESRALSFGTIIYSSGPRPVQQERERGRRLAKECPMNMKQIAKLMTAGVLAMAAAPSMSLARMHQPVQAASLTSLSASTITTPAVSKSKAAHKTLSTHAKRSLHLATTARKHTALSTRKHSSLSTRAKHTSLSTRKHSMLFAHKRSHTTLGTTLGHKSTKLSSKKTGM
jgi:hypothetical protein